MKNHRLLRNAPRGVSLIEGMTASAVLLFGLIGVLQGVIFASTQNSMAGRMTRASAIGKQLSTSLQLRGRSVLVDTANGLLNPTYCTATPATALQKAAGDLYPSSPLLSTLPGYTACFVDLDAYETANSGTPAKLILPRWDPQDARQFKRTLVFFSNPADTSVSYVGVVVSWNEQGRTHTIDQFFSLYDPAINQVGVEL